MRRRRPGSPCARRRCDFRSCASSSTNASRASAWSPASRSTRPEPTSGTGFLVGPDLVLTARHVLRDFIPRTAKAWTPMRTRCSPSSIISKASRSPIRATPGSRRVGCRLPTTGCCTRRTKCRPMARSKCPMPHRWRSSKPAWTSRWSGSPSRSVFTPAPKAAARDACGYRFRQWGCGAISRKDDRIIIPQHPHGHTLQIDFGRLKDIDQSTTRIRYDHRERSRARPARHASTITSTLALSNSTWSACTTPTTGRTALPILNQAIRFDHILGQILAFLGGQASLNALTKPSEVVNSRSGRRAAKRISNG